MRIVADSKIPLAKEAFSQFGEVLQLDTREITTLSVRDVDILVVRSETRIDSTLLDGSKVKFVGTATIGTDHVDLTYLLAKGVGFSSAPGCNANSVAEYIVAALLTLSNRFEFDLKGKVLGVVGVGNIGSKVVKYAGALGLTVLQNDPPRARQTGLPHFVPLDDLMGSDIVTLHVPLTRSGPDATFRLFDEARISKLRNQSILINTSRGAVVDTGALKGALKNKRLRACVLDVWEHEPHIDTELLQLSEVGTAHISGYSFDGKVNGTRMIYESLCRFYGEQPEWAPATSVTSEAGPTIFPHASVTRFEAALHQTVKQCYDIEKDDRALRGILNVPDGERPGYFQQLRSGYPLRREFSNSQVILGSAQRDFSEVLASLGFRVKHQPVQEV